jgi:Fe2+ transport system protein FeoA
MKNMGIPLAHLQKGKTAKILSIHDGHHGGRHGHHGHHGLKKRLNVLGIREGQIVTIVSKQPMMGPLTISVCNSQMTIGRGMAHKIIVEEL